MPDTLQAALGPKHPQAMSSSVLRPEAEERGPHGPSKTRQHPPSGKTVASIQQIFTLIAIVNGLVLIYLVVAAIQPLMAPGSHSKETHVTLILTLLLVILAIISYQIITSRIIRPIARLAREASEIESDDMISLLTIRNNDEISKLARAFNIVLLKMRQALLAGEASNQQLLEAKQQIEASINYAALLQRSILPDRQLKETLGNNYFILWLPRDTVGGDYYIFHSEGSHCLAGVADCAGHGVSGAMMTMLARAGIDHSIMEVGISSPAAILGCTDTAMRTLLHGASESKSIATSMDIGLARLDFEARTLRFAGAKISLYWSDGQTMHMLRGDPRAVCDQRVGVYTDHDIPLLPDCTYYLTTDGLLDQSGGDDGFSLGTHQFKEWLIQLARQPLEQQRQALADALEQFRGRYPQRDDITILSFRFS